MTPFSVPLAAFLGISTVAGVPPVECARLLCALLALIVPHRELVLALVGLALLRRGRNGMLDGPSLGWGMLLAAHAVSTWASPRSPAVFVFLGMAAFLLGGVWPFCASWLASDEGWGRRVGRGVLSIHFLGIVLPSVNPVAVEAWAPWALFMPALGLVWGGALALSPSGQRSSLSLLWFYELQLMALFILGTRGGRPETAVLLLWAIILPMAVLVATQAGSGRSATGHRTAQCAAGFALASLMAVPGLVGFAARFSAVATLLGSSPAGLACYAAGLLVLPALLRPLRDEMRSASLTLRTAATTAAATIGVILLGVLPGLSSGTWRGAGLWRFLLKG
ncbi:hypothetical protein JXA88_10390 [Candidatus Fermentibacteria bacterium]|nr:hypothetical protein [Candidatus Fermentibacteria bacterium]